jgi:hypothetical protein
VGQSMVDGLGVIGVTYRTGAMSVALRSSQDRLPKGSTAAALARLQRARVSRVHRANGRASQLAIARSMLG